MADTTPKRSDGLDPDVLRPSGALLAAQIALADAIDRHAVEGVGHDPTIIDLLVRLDLAPQKTLRAVDLCEQLLLSPSHISRMLDRAEASELVVREADPTDRRASLVSITTHGQAIVGEFAPRLYAVLQRSIHETLSPSEVDLLVGLLERVEASARSYSPPIDS